MEINTKCLVKVHSLAKEKIPYIRSVDGCSQSFPLKEEIEGEYPADKFSYEYVIQILCIDPHNSDSALVVHEQTIPLKDNQKAVHYVYFAGYTFAYIQHIEQLVLLTTHIFI